MSFNVLVTITGSTSLGPFQIAECTGYSEEGCTGCTDITNPSGVGITVNELTNGHYVNVTNDNTISIQLTSSGTCDNVICLLIDGRPTPTPTPTPTSTSTPTPTSTSTPIPPTETPTPTPTSTPTPTPTSTPIPPTSTPTPTPTSVPIECYEYTITGLSGLVASEKQVNFIGCDGGEDSVNASTSQVQTICARRNTVAPEYPEALINIDRGSLCGTETPTSTPTSTPIGCYEYTLGTSASSGQYYSFIDCDGIPGDGYIGGVGGYDATTVCAQTGQISAGGEIQVSTVGPCVVEPTPTPTNTPEPTPTTEPGADGICFGYTYTQYDVDNDLLPEVRYRDMSDTIVTTAITGLISVDNNDGTFTGYICVKQGSSYATPICVDGVYEVSCPNTWNEGSSCSSVITCAN